MFRGLINDAKSAVGSLMVKYLARASVAVPFVVAFGFSTAAITLMLVDRFGVINACWTVAGGFALIGLVATFVMTTKEHEEEVAEKEAEKTDTAGIAIEVATQAAVQAPLALLGALLSTSLGPATVAGVAKIVARNIPLVVLLALISLLFWPAEPALETTDTDTPGLGGKPNGAHPPAANDFDRDAA